MCWIETITIRLYNISDGKHIRDIFRDMFSGPRQAARQGFNAQLLECSEIDTDYCFNLYRQDTKRPPGKTAMGIQLAESIRALGMVSHSVWKTHEQDLDQIPPANITKQQNGDR